MTAPEQDTRPLPEPKLVELASRALLIAMRGPTDADMLDIAQKVVQRIGVEFPGEGIWCACLMWCDTVQANVAGLSTVEAQQSALAFIEEGTDRRSYADESVPESSQWAGRFLMARLRDDEDLAVALFNSTTDGWQMGARISALLSMAALNIQRGAVEQGTAAELGIGGPRA